MNHGICVKCMLRGKIDTVHSFVLTSLKTKLKEKTPFNQPPNLLDLKKLKDPNSEEIFSAHPGVKFASLSTVESDVDTHRRKPQ